MFSVLSSKLFGATSVALLALLAYVLVTKNTEISLQSKTIAEQNGTIKTLRENNATLKLNMGTLELAVNQCSAGVANAANAANAAARAGTAAASAAQSSRAETNRAVEALQALPRATCQDAEAILRQGAE